MMTERRSNPRKRTLLGGRACYNQRRSTLDCVVRNLSDTGALVLISDSVALPGAFDLEIDHLRQTYRARVRWRDGERVGLAFELQAKGACEVVPLDLARRLQHCEQNNARLKARIMQLTEAG